MAPRRRRNQTTSSSTGQGQGLPLYNTPAPAPAPAAAAVAPAPAAPAAVPAPVAAAPAPSPHCRTQEERDELRELRAFAQRTPLARFGDQYDWLVHAVIETVGYVGIVFGGYFLSQYLEDKSSKKQ
ncbi:hypothetical protein CEP54_000043 [Fusarium duplospermum]|uniref:Uncharacterized protein n=1 Tax=Fusarium duplospermum TaxID=1325734 RepID=A0A428R8C5_9HYPO|nr:hypothetical protein CEP54_000043 [Fusarium duplospermum]